MGEGKNVRQTPCQAWSPRQGPPSQDTDTMIPAETKSWALNQAPPTPTPWPFFPERASKSVSSGGLASLTHLVRLHLQQGNFRFL